MSDIKKIARVYINKKPAVKYLIRGDWQTSTMGRLHGRITVRHKGGGVKRNFRLIDFKRALWNVPGIVSSLEYDPNRRAYLALIFYNHIDILSYIVAPEGLQIGESVIAGFGAPTAPGNASLLKFIPLRVKIHNIEGYPTGGAKYCRSAGTWAIILNKRHNVAQLLFSNGKKKFSLDCLATFGVVSNSLSRSYIKKKAGYSRLKGIRPCVRGVAMNPVDHPHGGGNGKKSPRAVSMSPWGKLGKGIKTVLRKKNV